MKTFIIITLTILMLGNSHAAEIGIICQAERMGQTFVIEESGKITVLKEGEKHADRSIASASIRSQISASGFTKTTSINGKRYTIHVENIASPSEVEDFVSVRNDAGHEITYPLNCHK